MLALAPPKLLAAMQPCPTHIPIPSQRLSSEQHAPLRP
jgi:hypothetical protein